MGGQRWWPQYKSYYVVIKPSVLNCREDVNLSSGADKDTPSVSPSEQPSKPLCRTLKVLAYVQQTTHRRGAYLGGLRHACVYKSLIVIEKFSYHSPLTTSYSSSGQDAGFSSRQGEFDSLIGYQVLLGTVQSVRSNPNQSVCRRLTESNLYTKGWCSRILKLMSPAGYLRSTYAQTARYIMVYCSVSRHAVGSTGRQPTPLET